MDELMTQAEWDDLSKLMTPVIRDLLQLKPEQDLSIRISCTPISGEALMVVWSFLLDGKDLPSDQEKKITDFFHSVGIDSKPSRAPKA